MRLETKFCVMPLLLMLFVTATAVAGTPQPFEAGLEAFQNRDYELALEYFRQAEARGHQSPNLYYNLGVTCYKTGRYQQAEKEFKRLLSHPGWKPLALYNLGLVAEASGKREKAAAYYFDARDAAEPSSKVKQLSAYKIDKLQPERGKPGARPWFAYLSAAAGYDDNVVLAPEADVTRVGRKSDVYTDVYAAGGTRLAGDSRNGMRFDAGAYGRFYAGETEYNFATVFAGISRNRQYARWDFQGGLTGDAGFIGNAYYAATPGLYFTAARNLDDFRLEIGGELNWIEAQDAYAYLTGARSRWTLELTYWIPNGRASAGYELEFNEREDLHTGNAFFSYSPLRIGPYAEISYRFAAGWNIELKAAYRTSRYPDANRQINPDGSVTTEKRRDDRFRATARTGYQVTADLEVFGEYRHKDNDSNFSRYTYTSNEFLLGLEKTF